MGSRCPKPPVVVAAAEVVAVVAVVAVPAVLGLQGPLARVVAVVAPLVPLPPVQARLAVTPTTRMATEEQRTSGSTLPLPGNGRLLRPSGHG